MPFSSGVFRADVRLRSLTRSSKVMLGSILRSTGSVIYWNRDVVEGDVCICPSDHEQDGYSRGLTAYAAVLLSPDEIIKVATAFEHLAGFDWSSIARYRATHQMRETFCRKINASIEIVRSLGTDLSARAQKLMREEIVDGFLAAAAETVLSDARQPHIANSVRTVKLVEDYVAARNRMRLTSLSPARRALVEEQPGSTSVTEIAPDHGFFELGRFSDLYRQMFGESPSDTLRRQIERRRARSNPVRGRQAMSASSQEALSAPAAAIGKSSIARRSAARAPLNRDMTVPSGMPSTSATSR
jgi:AraC family ethanolamine operon transcriptional activator